MRTTFEDEDELAQQQSQPDRELTLSTTTLLAIFFGLVLICGLFFGLGYTLGRRSPSDSSNGPDPVQAATSPNIQPSGILPKPSAASQSAVVTPPNPAPEETQSTDADSTTTPDPAPEDKPSAKPAVKPVIAESTTPQPTQPKPTVQLAISSTPQPATAATSGVMVQIAAVSNAADADVLVKALQKHGYSAAVRREPNDNFLHVQVGPFASRAEANTIRQKLQNDGYNAILK